jgi:GNAT superfamily N-acetyltransferase
VRWQGLGPYVIRQQGMTDISESPAPFNLRSMVELDLRSVDDLYRPYSGRPIDFSRVRRAIDEYPSVVAVSGERLAGFCYCFRFAPDILELANIYIDPAFREARLGSRMLHHLIAQLNDHIRGIIAVNSDLNATAVQKKKPDAFYLRNGFNIIALTKASTIFWWERDSVPAR